MYNIELNNWWPQWTNYYSNTSLLRSFILNGAALGYSRAITKIYDLQGYKTYNTWGQPFRGWSCKTSVNPYTDIDLKLYINNTSYFVRRVFTDFDFYFSTDRIYRLFPDGTIIFRNLEIKEVAFDISVSNNTDTLLNNITTRFSPSQHPNNNSFILNNGYVDLLNTQNTTGLVVSLSESILPDTDVWFKQTLEFERLTVNSIDIDYTNGLVTLPIDIPGTLRYSSSALYNSITTTASVSINSGPLTSLQEISLMNGWDGLAWLFGLFRLPTESNYKVYSRIFNKFNMKLNSTKLGTSRGICNILGNIVTSTWVSSGNFTVPISGVKELYIENLPYIQFYEETLTSIGNNQYRLDKFPNSYTVLIDGIEIINTSISGNIITLPYTPIGKPVFKYSVLNYTTTLDSSGNILTINTNGNTPLNTYNVFLVSGISSYKLSNEYSSKLLSGNNPTSIFYDIQKIIDSKSSILIDTAKWDQVTWFEDSFITPNLNYLPRILE